MPVQRPRDWKRERDAEQSAGIEESGHILVETNKCSLCNIGIGPNHIEQEMYLYPIYRKSMWDGDDNWVFVEGSCVFCCGGCARHRKRNLSDDFLLIDYRRSRLEKEEGDLSIDQRMEALFYLWTRFLIHLSVDTVTITPYFSLRTLTQEKPVRPQVSSPSVTQRKGVTNPLALLQQRAVCV
jgi:hypothetical protein